MWQTASDFLIFLGWTWQNFITILDKVFLPVQFVYTFLKGLVVSAFSTPITPASIWSFNSQTLQVFNAIPYWDTLILVLILGLTILMIVFIFKQFLRV
jgi:hypothetical protein